MAVVTFFSFLVEVGSKSIWMVARKINSVCPPWNMVRYNNAHLSF